MAASYALRLIAGPGVDPSEIPALRIGGDPIETWFSNACGQQIGLQRRPVDSYRGRAGPAVNAWTLQQITSEFLTRNTAVKVHEIGLVFCRRWANALAADLYGLMFDYDGTDRDLGDTTSYNGVNREAAAVFLDALAGQDEEQIAKITCHELGHVFNLRHRPTGFMASGLGQSIGFHADDCSALARAGKGESPFAHRHLPGGEAFTPGGVGWSASLRQHPGWKFRASLPLKEYVMGQPVILEMELKNESGQRASVAATLDPGFADLRVWYQTPDGERRLFRPCLSYCQGPAYQVTLDPGETFRNNPRIHVGAAGPTFTQPGEYHVTADFQLRLGRGRRSMTLRADAGSVVVRLPTHGEAAASSLSRRARVALFLAQKGGPLSRAERRGLTELAEAAPRDAIARHARYALASRFASRHAWAKAAHLTRRLRMHEPSLQEGLARLRHQIEQGLRGRQVGPRA